MKTFYQIVLTILLCLAPLAVASAQQPGAALKLEPDLSLMRVLPAVYMVRFFGDGEVTMPSAVEIHLDGLDKEFDQAVAEKKIPPTADRVEFKWAMLRTALDRYLKASSQMLQLKQIVSCWGTAFAISKEGILLTNRHVVQADKAKALDAQTIDSYAPKPAVQMADALIAALGKTPEDLGTCQATIISLLDWYGKKCQQTGRYTHGEILLAYANQNDLTDPARLALRTTLGKFGLDTREPIVAPITVVAKGGDHAYEDVAILRLDAQTNDALVCLPLAGDDFAKQGMAVCSFGFPDWRYDPETMGSLELLQVNDSRGAIQLLPHSDQGPLGDRLRARFREIGGDLQGLMLVSTMMWHGVSGGPVATDQGVVVGLNVMGSEILLPEELQPKNSLFGKQAKLINNFAVPIAAARKLLAENKITPNVGTTGQLWNEGLELYRAGRYAEAQGKFREVADRQKIALGKPGNPPGVVKKPYEAGGGAATPNRSVVNLYVQEMLNLSQARANAARN